MGVDKTERRTKDSALGSPRLRAQERLTSNLVGTAKTVGGNSLLYAVCCFSVHFSFHMYLGHLKPENFLVMSFAYFLLYLSFC